MTGIKRTPRGRPRRPGRKAKPIWVGQRDLDVIKEVERVLTPEQRWELLRLGHDEMREYGGIQRILRVRNTTQAEDEMLAERHMTVEEPPEPWFQALGTARNIIDTVGELPVRIVTSIATSPCFANLVPEYSHWELEDTLVWAATLGDLGRVELGITDASEYYVEWTLMLLDRHDRTVLYLTEPRSTEPWSQYSVKCTLKTLRDSLKTMENAKLAVGALERLKESNDAE